MTLQTARLARLGAVVALAAMSTACATITRGTKEDFTVASEPAGAKVETTQGVSCPSTPCTWKLPHNAKFTVTISKQGYKTVTANVTHQIAGAGVAGLVGNVVIGGPIGVGIDAVTGSSQELKPNPLKVTLEPETATAGGGSAGEAPAAPK